MKLKFDEKLFKYSKYIVMTFIVIYLSFAFMQNFGNIFAYISGSLKYIIALINPLLVAIVIAYLIFPLSNAIESKLNQIFTKRKPKPVKEEIIKSDIKKIFHKKKKPGKKQAAFRMVSVILSYLLIIGVLLGVLLGIYFMIGGQLTKTMSITAIIDSVHSYLSQATSQNLSFADNINNLDIPIINSFKPQLIELTDSIQKYVVENIGNMTSSVFQIGSNVANFFVALVISIYILKDIEYFTTLWSNIYELFGGRTRLGKSVKNVALVFHENFSQFIRGQLLEALAVAIMSSIALTILKVDYAIVIGSIAGIMNMIPYVGPVVGTVLACLMALLSGDPIKVIYIIIVMMIIQFIDGNVLAPKIIGDSVGLHPVFIMIGIIVGGYLAGFVGMLIAVPIAASFRVLFVRWYETHSDGIKPNITIEMEK